mmetsp:Transcript_31396/g.74626  ORF Transcript_31396/g.74626 Transcript_31396/m.74626 type:complete len:322 (-) Transcript_31396:744-1709(-)
MPPDLVLVDRPDVDARRDCLHLLVVVLHQLQHVGVLVADVRHGFPPLLLLSEPDLVHLVAELAAAHGPSYDLRDVAFLHDRHLVLRREGHGDHLSQLPVLPLEEALLDVGDGVEDEVLLEMVHRVLRDVCHPEVMMLEELALVGGPPVAHLEIANEQLEEGGLARAVGSDQRHPRGHAQLLRHPLKNILRATLVAEDDVGEAHDGLQPRFDPVEDAGVWELDQRFSDPRFLSKVGGVLLLGEGLDHVWTRRRKLCPSRLVVVELHIGKVDNVRDSLVQEVVVVRHDHGRRALKLTQVIGEPGDRVDVEVVRRLVQKEQVRL